jgi:hypothetical protein
MTVVSAVLLGGNPMLCLFPLREDVLLNMNGYKICGNFARNGAINIIIA